MSQNKPVVNPMKDADMAIAAEAIVKGMLNQNRTPVESASTRYYFSI